MIYPVTERTAGGKAIHRKTVSGDFAMVTINMSQVRQTPIVSLTLEDVYLARERISHFATRTPLKISLSLEGLIGRPVYLKMETIQATGAFKIRGAANAILALGHDRRANDVVAASSGNQGRAVAYVASQLGIPATICLSELVPLAKACRHW